MRSFSEKQGRYRYLLYEKYDSVLLRSVKYEFENVTFKIVHLQYIKYVAAEATRPKYYNQNYTVWKKKYPHSD